MKQSLKSLASDSLIYGLANAFNKASILLLMPLYAKRLLPDEFGTIHLINNVFLLINMLSLLAMDNAVAIHFYNTEVEAERKQLFSIWFYTVLGINIILLAIGLYGSEYWALELTGKASTSNLIRYASWNQFFSFLPYIFSFWYRIQRKPAANAMYMSGGALLNIGLNVVFVLMFNSGIEGFFISQMAASALQSIIGLLLFMSWMPLSLFNMQKLKEMFLMSYPLIFYGISAWILSYSSIYFVKLYVKDPAQIGIYQLGILIASFLGFLINAFGQAWGPYVQSIKTHPTAKVSYAKAMYLYCLATVTAATLLSIFMKEIILIFSSVSYIGAEPIAILMLFNAILTGFNFIAATGFQVGNLINLKIVGFANSIGSLIIVTCFILLIPIFGKLGAVFSIWGINLAVVLFLFYKAQNYVRIPFPFAFAITFYFMPLIFCFALAYLPLFDRIGIKLAAGVMMLIVSLVCFKKMNRFVAES